MIKNPSWRRCVLLAAMIDLLCGLEGGLARLMGLGDRAVELWTLDQMLCVVIMLICLYLQWKARRA